MPVSGALARSLVATIPSPGEWGRSSHLYGIMIMLGVVLGIMLARARWRARGGDPEDMLDIAIWAVPAGLIGARLYHVITDNQLYRAPKGTWTDAFKLWNGGLGIPGGILAGVLVGVWVGHRKGIRLAPGLDTVAPCLALAQAIGRWGNYFNVELFGGPTDLPWGLEVPLTKRPTDLAQYSTFQPTFLYESLWNFGLVVFLIWLDRKRVVRPGRIFALYIGGYFTGRLWVESLRSDPANLILGLRVNIWLSLLCMAGVAIFLAVFGLRRRPGDSDAPYEDGHRFDRETAATASDAVDAVDAVDASGRGVRPDDDDAATPVPEVQPASGGGAVDSSDEI